VKCSDIPTIPILEFLNSLGEQKAFMFSNHPASIFNAMTKEADYNLVLAKMRSLIKKGLVEGCGCGCRGDFGITDKGKEYLGMR
jgi:hypothetical protein